MVQLKERFIESHFWYCTGKYLLVLQFFTFFTSLFLYRILGHVMFIALFPKDHVSQTVLAAHQCLFPLDIFHHRLQCKPTTYFTYRWTGIWTSLSVDWDKSSVPLSYVHIRSLCCCHTVWCMFSVGFTSAVGKGSLWAFAYPAHFYNLFPPTTRTDCHETLKLFLILIILNVFYAFSLLNTSYLYSGVHSQEKLYTQRNKIVSWIYQ